MRQFFLSIACVIRAVGLVLTACCCPTLIADEGGSFDHQAATTVTRYCAHCHGEGDEIEGEVDLSELMGANTASRTHLIRRALDVLDQGLMPPEDVVQPTAAQRRQLVEALQQLLDQSDAPAMLYPPTPLRRMNRLQYNNAVTDLFDLKCVVFALPERMLREHNGYFQPASGSMPEVVTVGSRPLGKSQLIEPRLGGVAPFPQDLRAEHGFDNRADHLSLSPLLLEAFLNLGQSIVESPDFGPRNVGAWHRLFAPLPPDVEPATAARERLAWFLQRAFRRPAADDELDRYAGYVTRQFDAGVAFPDAMKAVAAAAISSPNFLYLYDTADTAPPAADAVRVVPLDDFELASRLSFFLWGSIPDEELLSLAARGELSRPDVLEHQIGRMLRDRRLKRFCDSFPAQWLQLERIISSVPDPQQFPQFYFSKYRASMHMMLEPLLLFETVLIENRPITELIDAAFSYRTPLLDRLYGELGGDAAFSGSRGPQVAVLKFRRVSLADRRTGGVITNAAVMTMTSGPKRTKPITRGAWMAEVIFNDPPQPPPADVPPLSEQPSADEEQLTLRQRIALHRQRNDCRGCHEKIDPLGFALENYDPIRAWRERYENDRPIDAAGTLFRRHRFTDAVGLKDAILAEKDRFAHGLAGHLLSFALA
ncbi:MAG: DUF1592 domain-containing protein, partial [Planctomycetota bacterium]